MKPAPFTYHRATSAKEAVEMLAPTLSLEDVYLAVLIGARSLAVRLRPELKGTESLHAMRVGLC